jgi:putative flippase GtrA
VIKAPLPPAWVGQVIRFGLVGGLAAMLDYGVLWLVVHAGGSRYAARVLSIAVAMLFTWVLNRTLTFRTEAPPTWREFIHYMAVGLSGSLLNLAIYWCLLWLRATTSVAFVAGTLLTAIYSFLRYRSLLGPARQKGDRRSRSWWTARLGRF